MIKLVLESIYFFLPAYLANSAASLSAKTPYLKEVSHPLDFGLKLKNRRVLGGHKTWRGLVCGVLSGLISGWIQTKLFEFDFFQSISTCDYTDLDFVLRLSFLLGFGALFGDAAKSFFKRRIGIKPGKSWPPFDQLDIVFGGLLFSRLVFPIPLANMLVIFLVTPFLMLGSNVISYFLHLKDVWY